MEEGKPYFLRNYQSDDGKDPFKQWILRLRDRRARARINVRLRRIEEFGQFGVYRHVGEGVHELKFDFGPGYRVYFGLDGETVVILLGGGDKSTQRQDIAAALQRWKEYLDA